MNTHADKTQENKSKSVSSANSQKQNDVKSTFQFVDNRPDAITQRKLQKMANNSPQVKKTAQLQEMTKNHSATQQQSNQKKKNNTGLPDHLKTGIENLSGYSMDDVKVHYNSDKPAQLQAHAYAQGTEIHLASGQEKHLPHEAWHVVQQKQGRVKPTLQMKGKMNVNEDIGLEKEADVMGAKVSNQSFKETNTSTKSTHRNANVVQFVISYKGYFSGNEESWVTWTNAWKSVNLGKKWKTIQTLDQKVGNYIDKLQLKGNFTAKILTWAENRYEKLQTEIVPRSKANSTIQSYQIINLRLKKVEASAAYKNAQRVYSKIIHSESNKTSKMNYWKLPKEVTGIVL